MHKKNLLELPENEYAYISTIGTPDHIRTRLMDLGFTPGAKIYCLFSAPAGDPRAYMVRGSVIALRASDAERIYISTGSAV